MNAQVSPSTYTLITHQITTEDGLPSNEIYQVFQDDYGYIWFATDVGVSRYNGREFTNFSMKDGLVDNTVFGFYEDHEKRLWLRSFSGKLCYFTQGTDSVYSYVYNDKIDNFARGVEKTPITFNTEFDRVYTNSNDCYIEDEKFNRVITIKKSNSNSTVVWTPWQKKSLAMGDMGKQDEWRRMVCVETANLLENSVVIYPKLSHSIATEYSVQEY